MILYRDFFSQASSLNMQLSNAHFISIAVTIQRKTSVLLFSQEFENERILLSIRTKEDSQNESSKAAYSLLCLSIHNDARNILSFSNS